MADPGNGTEIIIKGGSVEVDFDGNTYTKDPNDPRKHKNATRKIIRVVVTDETNPGSPVEVYNSGDRPGGFKCQIKATCG